MCDDLNLTLLETADGYYLVAENNSAEVVLEGKVVPARQ